MRIIAGKFKSRKLVTLAGPNTRPMTDRMKESVFNIIGPYFNNEEVLDLFGGSGALSLESISRGAKSSVIVEKSIEAARVIKTNVENLNLEDSVMLMQMDYQVALNKIKNLKKEFEIVFLDPPYQLHVIDEILNFLITNKLVKKDGYIICHYYQNNHLPVEYDNLRIIRHNNHGSSEFCIYQIV